MLTTYSNRDDNLGFDLSSYDVIQGQNLVIQIRELPVGFETALMSWQQKTGTNGLGDIIQSDIYDGSTWAGSTGSIVDDTLVLTIPISKSLDDFAPNTYHTFQFFLVENNTIQISFKIARLDPDGPIDTVIQPPLAGDSGKVATVNLQQSNYEPYELLNSVIDHNLKTIRLPSDSLTRVTVGADVNNDYVFSNYTSPTEAIQTALDGNVRHVILTSSCTVEHNPAYDQIYRGVNRKLALAIPSYTTFEFLPGVVMTYESGDPLNVGQSFCSAIGNFGTCIRPKVINSAFHGLSTQTGVDSDEHHSIYFLGDESLGWYVVRPQIINTYSERTASGAYRYRGNDCFLPYIDNFTTDFCDAALIMTVGTTDAYVGSCDVRNSYAEGLFFEDFSGLTGGNWNIDGTDSQIGIRFGTFFTGNDNRFVNISNIKAVNCGLHGIEFSGMEYGNVTNLITGNNQNHGIFISDGKVENSNKTRVLNITNGVSYNNNQNGAQNAGVYIKNAEYVNFSNFYAIDDQTIPTQYRGFDMVGTDYISLSNVTAYGNINQQIILDGLHSNVSNTRGYNNSIEINSITQNLTSPVDFVFLNPNTNEAEVILPPISTLNNEWQINISNISPNFQSRISPTLGDEINSLGASQSYIMLPNESLLLKKDNSKFKTLFNSGNGTDIPLLPPDDASLVSNMVLWLDSSDSASITLGGSFVNTWSEKITANYTGTRSAIQSGASRPSYVIAGFNSLDVLNFNGTNSFMNLSSNLPLTGEFTKFVIIRPNIITGNRFWLGHSTETSKEGIVGPNQAFRFINGGTVDTSYSNTMISNNIAVHVTSRNASNVCSWQYNEGPTNNLFLGAPQVGTYNINRIARDETTNYYSGQIGEILIYNRVLSNFEKQGLIKYIKSKWGAF